MTAKIHLFVTLACVACSVGCMGSEDVGESLEQLEQRIATLSDRKALSE
jgi:hypothetical protein